MKSANNVQTKTVPKVGFDEKNVEFFKVNISLKKNCVIKAINIDQKDLYVYHA